MEKCVGRKVVDPETGKISYVFPMPIRYWEGEQLGDVLKKIESQITSGDLTLNERVTVVISRNEILEL